MTLHSPFVKLLAIIAFDSLSAVKLLATVTVTFAPLSAIFWLISLSLSLFSMRILATFTVTVPVTIVAVVCHAGPVPRYSGVFCALMEIYTISSIHQTQTTSTP